MGIKLKLKAATWGTYHIYMGEDENHVVGKIMKTAGTGPKFGVFNGQGKCLIAKPFINVPEAFAAFKKHFHIQEGKKK